MPRQPDLEVEGHILDAAYRLWRSKGERGLTMRAVAREAGTIIRRCISDLKTKEKFWRRCDCARSCNFSPR